MTNGALPSSALSPIGGGFYLEKGAAESFAAMSREAFERFGTHIHVVAAYRTLSKQWYFWNLYKSGRGNLAAYPGTSNHGLGLAIDLASPHMRAIIDAIGAKYGWSKSWSDAPGEWWHIKFNASQWRKNRHHLLHAHMTLHYGMRGPAVKSLQHVLRSQGFKSVKESGVFGTGTLRAVKHIQKKHHIKADGIVGPHTRRIIYG